MELMQPWMSIASAVAGVVVSGVAVGWWSRGRLVRARRLIDVLEASRQQLAQQNNQARRQVELLQVEMAELRLLAERVRRRESPSVSPADTLMPMVQTGAMPAPGHAPVQTHGSLQGHGDARMQPQPLGHAPVHGAVSGSVLGGAAAASLLSPVSLSPLSLFPDSAPPDASFRDTQIDDDDDENHGFAPTQVDKPF